MNSKEIDYHKLELHSHITGLDLTLRMSGDVVWIDLPNDIDVIMGDQRFNNQSKVIIRLGKPKKKDK